MNDAYVHVKLPSIPPHHSSIIHCAKQYRPRTPVLRDIGLAMKDAAPPHPDPRSYLNCLAGITKRLDIPNVASKTTIRQFRSFVRVWLRRNLTPFSADHVFELESWLSESNYNEARKEEIRTAYKNSLDTGKIKKSINSFIKSEDYDEYKFPRVINSRHDQFKAFFGPYCHDLEKIMYQMPEFIKHVPINDRPAYISEMLGAVGPYYATDYSSFEGTQCSELLQACELQLYSYMFRHFPDAVREIREAILQRPILTFRGSKLSVKVDACRMSGEMSTSLGNGFLNMMVIKFLCRRKDLTPSVVVEGDDGIIACRDFPAPSDFLQLNLRVKTEKHDSFQTASFCGLVFTDDHDVVINPVRKMVRFGWSDSIKMHGGVKVTKGLLRAKAFSLLAEAPGNPITHVLALKALELTTGYKPIYEDNYKTRMLGDLRPEGTFMQKCIAKRPTRQMRELVSLKFNVSLCDQLHIEAYIRGLTNLEPLVDPVMLSVVQASMPDCIQNMDYVIQTDKPYKDTCDMMPLSD